MTDVSTFYGDAVNRAVKPEKLADAVKWLDKAIQFEGEGEGGPSAKKLEMAWKAAERAEREAFGITA